MKRLLLILLPLLLIIGCAKIPDDQQLFINKWKSLKKTKNYSGGEKHLKNNRATITKWYGEFVEYKYDRILLKHKGIEYNLYPELPFSNEGRKINSLQKGDKVNFSGRLNGEKSITNSGALSEPEMKVICNKLTNTDGNIVYFNFSQKEIEEFRLAEIEREEEARRRSRMCKLEGCSRDGIGWSHFDPYGDYVGCMRYVDSGGYCSKSHCAAESSSEE
jgi:hypothetical protein